MPDRRIRVLLVALPPLARSLLTAPMRDAGDIEVVDDEVSLPLLPERARLADVVVLPARDGALPDEAEALLAGHGVPTFVGVEFHNGTGYVVGLKTSWSPLGPVSPDEVVAAIRTIGTAR